jgi:hypothetical protein
VAGTALVPYRAKLWTAEQFWTACQVAKRAARDALGYRWDLVEGESHHMIMPVRYGGFRTLMGTRLKVSRDQRIPAARWWVGGELPPGVVAMLDGPREAPRDGQVRVPRSHRIEYSGSAIVLDLTPEEWPEDARAEFSEAAD